ncbi:MULTISPECIES: FHA domain-containing protein [Streptomyces]|uniref:Cell division protein FtsK n=1 Tax=Streptomyces dengpaensis TaxID=2049881 RepID=A0ABM6SUN0_9ACTN|nr:MULTISPECIES: FHA domain-containing protein [Streptomyces]AVH58439.1 cell division protein FtsK [Streptomyces dengpaensis]PIB06111.1 cell division protein FtsK [Streptomyces sp. HG99]
MQIRLTVVDPLGPLSEPRGRAAACDVLVTAPAGTALAAVAAGLASAVGGGDGPVVLYAGAERLDGQRCTLGEPPLTDGAVLSLGAPAEPGPDVDDGAAQLHVVAGPDAGGVHFLHGGQIRIGRSADADVPLDDPDVSRLHCAVTVTPEGRVSVTDLGSTNGTTLDGTPVGTRPLRLAPGALLRVGESALRLAPPGGPGALGTAPDGEGHVRVTAATDTPAAPPPRTASAVPHARVEGVAGASGAQGSPAPAAGETHHAYGSAEWGAAEGVPGAQEHSAAGSPVVPGQGRAPGIESRPRDGAEPVSPGAVAERADTPAPGTRKGTPARGTDVPAGVRRRGGGIGAWARRLTGGRGGPAGTGQDPYGDADATAEELLPAVPRSPESWPDPATLLLTALGPGPRLWERGTGHPEALTVRLGTADRATPDGSGLLPAVPVTADLREVGALGLAGPRPRLAGLVRAVVAQLAALHSPDALEIVLISTDRSRTVEERTAEWSWLGWLPHLRPAHGQDCRLLLAYDREQAAARTDELLRRLDDHLTETARGPRPDGGTGTDPRPYDDAPGTVRGAARRPSWARDDDPAGAGFDGPYTVVVVDGDPGGTDVRESVLRLTHEGARAGIHAVCLAETPAASPASPVTETYETACAASPAFRACGAVALLSGDVATALRLLRVAPGGPGASPGGAARGGAGGSAPGDSAGRSRDGAGYPRGGAAHSGSAQGAPAYPGSAQGEPTPDRLMRGGSTFPDSTHGDSTHGGPSHRGSTHPGSAQGEPKHPGATGAPLTGASSASGAYGVSGASGAAGVPDAGSSYGGNTHPGTAGQLPRGPVGHGTVAAIDAVSVAWAERFARALAPLRTDGTHRERHARVSAPLPQAARLLDELGLARATPASLMARWADAADDTEALGGRGRIVLGAGPRGPVTADLPVEGPHLLIEGPPGSGRTELLRTVAASLAAAERPDRLGIVLIDGRDGTGSGAGRGEGLQVCTDLPHVTTHLAANDPVRMREFAQALSAELKRRAELLGRLDFAEWHTRREVSGRIVAQRSAQSPSGRVPGATSGMAPGTPSGAGDLDAPPSSTLRLRPAAARERTEPGPPLARLVVVVDDLDALLSPALGSPGRPSAGSVVRALEAVAREGERLGVHLVAAAGVDGRTGGSELGRSAALRVALDAPVPGADEAGPGRGRLLRPDGRDVPFQGGRVTGRIPRTATLRPTVVPLEWHRMGDPPARRPVRELGNGPTDLALLASALERAARSVAAVEVPSLL